MNQDIYVVIEHLQGKVSDISYIMLSAARELANSTNGSVVAVLLGQNAQGLSADLLANSLIYIDHPALAEFTSVAYQDTLSNLIEENQPRAILFGNTSIGSDVASVLSARLGLTMVNACHHFENGKFISQICGGKIMVEGIVPEPTAIITIIPGGYKPDEGKSEQPPEINIFDPPPLEELSVKLINYLEPDTSDIDISNEQILVSVGRGIQTEDNLEIATELAQALGATVCASRPVVDQGWLPTSRMVGKSGKIVKPKLYLALGISGAPEHVESITDSEMIIAINTDPNAPIFDIATYGAEVDLLDLAEILVEQIEEG